MVRKMAFLCLVLLWKKQKKKKIQIYLKLVGNLCIFKLFNFYIEELNLCLDMLPIFYF